MEKVDFIETELSEEVIKALSIYDVSSSYSLMDEIRQQQLKCEENCIKQVVEQYTGKPLTIDDAQKVQRAFRQGDYSKYILAFNGVQLGMIRYINDGCNFAVEFTPNEVSF